MKKMISRALAVMLASCMAVSCAGSSSSSTTTSVATTTQEASLSVVTTIFPIYDWTKVVLGDDLENVTLTFLEDTGVDVHSFEPTVEDMVAMTNCDMFIYVGGESDDWVDAVLANAENPDMVVINLLDVLGDSVMEEAEVEGMQEHDHDHDDEEEDHDHDDEEVVEDDHNHDDEDDHDHDDEEVVEDDHNHDDEDDHDHDDEEVVEDDHDHDDEDDHDHDDEEVVEDDHDHDEEEDHDHDDEEAELDEHVWLSFNNATVVCQIIADELSVLNPAQADLYSANVSDYILQLNDLDAQYQAVVEQANQTTLLFADRFPFLYLMEDYGLSYYAAFSGCSSETEATFETIAFLAGKIDELGLTVVLTTEDPAPNVAETVIESATNGGQTILALDSMQAVTASEVTAGATYLSIMESNLEVLAQAVQ